MVFQWYRRRKRAYGNKRSSKWPEVRKAHLKAHGTCAVCGVNKHLEVHHIMPFHIDPKLELDPKNLITLCESKSHNDHLIFGHLLDFKSMNPNVATDSKNYHAAVSKRKIGKGKSG